MYYVYILRCRDNTLYTGTASDIEKRLSEHFSDSPKKAKYTKAHAPERLEAAWLCKTKGDALRLEYRIKELTKPAKEELIRSNTAPESICLKLLDMEIERLDIEKIGSGH